MDERMKILSLLQEGKITLEQADLLLKALDRESAQSGEESKSKSGSWEKTTQELKSLKQQMSSLMAQTVSEVKRNIETQFDGWPFGEFVSATVEHQIAAGTEELELLVSSGKIHVESWDGPNIRVYVRAEVRPVEGFPAKKVLEDAIDVRETSERASLQILRSDGRRVLGATSVDLFIPRTNEHVSTGSSLKLQIENKNGNIHVDNVNLPSFSAKTYNGNLVIANVQTRTMEVETQNGSIDIKNSVQFITRRVYAASKNGTITLTGIQPGLVCAGYARTASGIIEVDERTFDCTFDDARQRNRATFRSSAPAAEAETRLELETKHGKIVIRG